MMSVMTQFERLYSFSEGGRVNGGDIQILAS